MSVTTSVPAFSLCAEPGNRIAPTRSAFSARALRTDGSSLSRVPVLGDVHHEPARLDLVGDFRKK
jgi:hypothetical protein